MPRCVIQGISHDGQGVGRVDGLAVFVPGTLPGEIADIEIVQTRKNFARGRLETLVTTVPERVAPPCEYYLQCGGCTYQHASYPLHLDLKTDVVTQSLKRIGGVEAPVDPCLPSPQPWRYRNKVTWHAAANGHGWDMGYYGPDGRKLLNIADCLLISQSMQDLSNRIAAGLRQLSPVDHPVDIVVRQSSLSGNLTVITSGVSHEQARILADQVNDPPVSVAVADNNQVTPVAGQETLEDAIGDIRYRFHPLSFFQVNPGQTENLVDMVKDLLSVQHSEQILDAYCGVGTIALQLAPLARKVVGIEFFAPAVQDAKQNAHLNGFRNCRFLTGAAENVLPTLTNRFEAVILDPPRYGCHPGVIQAISRLKIPTAVYVSCEPSTLARDLKRFQEAGYRVEKVQPLDMFPWTRHVETVVLMSRVDKQECRKALK